MDVSEPASDEGRESMSSSVLAGGMLAYEEDGSDMMGWLLVCYTLLRILMVEGNDSTVINFGARGINMKVKTSNATVSECSDHMEAWPSLSVTDVHRLTFLNFYARHKA
jgi:hypothetical protein